MFQDFSKGFTGMSQFRQILEIQTRLLEALAREQADCTKSCLDATLAQTREMQRCHNPTDLLHLQQNYAQMLEKLLRESSQNNMQMLSDAREQLEELAQDAFNPFADKN